MRLIDAEGMKDWIMKSIPSPTGALASVRETLLIAVDEQPTVEPERGAGGWISVKDRLPDAAGVYLVSGKRISTAPYIYTAHFATDLCQNPYLEWEGVRHEPGFWNGDGDEDWIEPGVTHWMPLPEPPEVTKNG